MKYFWWAIGHDLAGVVKANSIEEAKKKVALSHDVSKYVDAWSVHPRFVPPLNEEEYDENDVAVMVWL